MHMRGRRSDPPWWKIPGHRQNKDAHEQPSNAPLMPQMHARHAALASVSVFVKRPHVSR